MRKFTLEIDEEIHRALLSALNDRSASLTRQKAACEEAYRLVYDAKEVNSSPEKTEPEP